MIRPVAGIVSRTEGDSISRMGAEAKSDAERGDARDLRACAQPCPMCGSVEPPVYVHGHSQCATCKINIDPCCGGAPLDGLEAA